MQGQELQDARTWDDLLQRTDSKSVTSVAENCLRSITDKRQTCSTIIEEAKHDIVLSQDINSVSQQIQNLIDDVTETLQALSSDINRQLVELGDRFLKR